MTGRPEGLRYTRLAGLKPCATRDWRDAHCGSAGLQACHKLDRHEEGRDAAAARAVPLEGRRSRPPEGRGSPRLPLEQAGRRPHAHEHGRRQHVVETDGGRSADGRRGRGVVGEGIGRRSADREARRVRVAVSRQGARDAAAVRGRSPSRAQDAGRRRDVPDVQPLRLQPEPARVLDRHAAPHVRAVPARRSPAPERRHRHRRVGEPGAALPGDLWRRRDLRAVAASRLRHRVDDRGPDQGEPEGERRAPRPPRHELVEQRRQDLLRNRARDHRSGDGLHRAA